MPSRRGRADGEPGCTSLPGSAKSLVGNGDFTYFSRRAADTREYFQPLAERMNWSDNCSAINEMEPSPMWIHESAEERTVRWNWIAILSYAASLAVSLAIWKGVFLAAGRLLK